MSNGKSRTPARIGPADIDRSYVAAAKVMHVSGLGLAISASACGVNTSAVANA